MCLKHKKAPNEPAAGVKNKIAFSISPFRIGEIREKSAAIPSPMNHIKITYRDMRIDSSRFPFSIAET